MIIFGNLFIQKFWFLSMILLLITLVPAMAAKADNQDNKPRRALLVIDVQKVYFAGGLKVTHPECSLENILKAMDAAKENGIEVVIVQHTSKSPTSSFRQGNPAWELHPEVAKRPKAHLVEKNYAGSFTNTDLEKWLRENNINTVVITGYMTQMCCDTTSRQASHLDFNVEFLSDATGTLAFDNAGGKVTAEEMHRAILVAQASGLSKVVTTDVWIEMINKDQ